MYNASFILVSMLLLLQKDLSFGLETDQLSSCETMLRARAPRLRRRLQQCCTSRLLDSTTHADLAWGHVESCISACRRMLPALAPWPSRSCSAVPLAAHDDLCCSRREPHHRGTDYGRPSRQPPRDTRVSYPLPQAPQASSSPAAASVQTSKLVRSCSDPA